MRLAPALSALLLLAAPAAAQSVSHGVDGRFGVVYSDEAGGTTRAVADSRYTARIRQPWDNGLYFGFSMSVGISNQAARDQDGYRDVGPRFRLRASGS